MVQTALTDSNSQFYKNLLRVATITTTRMFRQVFSGDESTRIHAAAGGAALEAKDVGGIDGRLEDAQVRGGTQKRNVPK